MVQEVIQNGLDWDINIRGSKHDDLLARGGPVIPWELKHGGNIGQGRSLLQTQTQIREDTVQDEIAHRTRSSQEKRSHFGSEPPASRIRLVPSAAYSASPGPSSRRPDPGRQRPAPSIAPAPDPSSRRSGAAVPRGRPQQQRDREKKKKRKRMIPAPGAGVRRIVTVKVGEGAGEPSVHLGPSLILRMTWCLVMLFLHEYV